MTDAPPSPGSPRPFVLHAPNVHGGGGRALLLPLLEALKPPATVLLDTRLSPLPALHPGVRVLRFPPTLAGRLRAEIALRRLAVPENDILCFGNLPPLLARAEANTTVFLQNRYLLPPSPLDGLPLRTKARLVIERIWLRSRRGAARLMVQSETMAAAARHAFGQTAEVCPFTAGIPAPSERAAQKTIDFLYVASGEAHKNHATLLAAWEGLAKDGLTPTLGLTLAPPDQARLQHALEKARAAGARIALLPPRSPDEMPALYAAAHAVIYPSLFESFGLPLIEAQAAGLPILAAERDYVRDLVDPDQSFDPTSHRSIARAVRRHLGQPAPRPVILDASGLLARLRGRR
ncbi:glycosyltransferase family 4 protein [Tabrizicola sp. TH137]|uniref:glycosyltransferase family 4 protein n=1 Tax=Tabrizicola sp. TH137 TaxID=2067452 RepID=UPI0013043D5C|nr:glycosyltransferase family 4 protein [Tabrizicola sp. TH137]